MRRSRIAIGLVACGAIVAGAATPGTAGGAPGPDRLVGLDPAKLGSQRSQFAEAPVTPARGLNRAPGPASQIPADAWSVDVPTGTGTLSIFVSAAYVQDEANTAAATSYGEFLLGLLHGPEIDELAVYVAPPREIVLACSRSGAACYLPAAEEMIVPGEPPAGGEFTVEDVVTHEYGHHVANNRDNRPFPALVYGPKRWADHERVCPGIETGRLDPFGYETNPAEGFAEAYLVTNGGLWGEIVSRPFFFPDRTAMELIARDVTDPWRGLRTLKWRPKLRRISGPIWAARRRIKPLLDGNLTITMKVPRKKDFDLFLSDGSGRISLADSARPRGRDERIRGVVCGENRLTLDVTGFRSGGRPRVTISKA